MQGAWAPRGFVRLACRLGWQRATGAVELIEDGGGRHRLFVRLGDVVSIQLGDGRIRLGELLCTETGVAPRRVDDLLARAVERAPLGRLLVNQRLVSAPVVERALSRQSLLRLDHLAGLGPGRWRFDDGADPPEARTRTRPQSLLSWARGRLSQQLDRVGVPEGLRRAELALPHRALSDPAMLDPVERRMVRALSEPRRLSELVSEAGATEREAVVFVWMLEHAGVLEARDLTPPVPAVVDPTAEARRLLGIGLGADAGEIRAAFRRLARENHPDRHAGASRQRLRLLTSRLAALNAAYRLLMSGAHRAGG